MMETLSAWLACSRQVAFQVVVAGRVSGGLFEEAFHRPVRVAFEDDTLTIEFDHRERLVVSQAMGIGHTSHGDLTIAQGSGVSFTWCPDPGPDCPEAWITESYTATSSGFALLSIIIDPAAAPSPVDPFPTMVPLGGEGVPFVRLARIAGA